MTYAPCKSIVKAELHPVAFSPYTRCAIMPGMNRPGTHLAHWRAFRGLTQAQVVDRLAQMDDARLPTTAASLSRLESGKQPYSQRIIEALAEIYDTDPGALIDHDPRRVAHALEVLSRLPDSDREQAEAMLEAMARVAESRPDYRPPNNH